ncbi:uncharacterized protein EI90DRAFT_3073118 [Cantharellus anzutake]|uniref:uncharacterized protein n=1 Tax=Cantharellus anzutake TaxID=1750568 RepID=UPI001904EDF3|nr:uncharacterized protein EI90DRAFT_3073118 [Cantharellus anzutake]KAF8325154.1 hypothetical protein EI90DRAFT_3073118 [Cantharellus anzutake]
MGSIFLQILKLCMPQYSRRGDQEGDQEGQHQSPGPQHQQHQPLQYPQPQHQTSPHPHKYQHRIDANQQNQSNPHYLELRSRARAEGDKMAHCFDQSHRAYEEGDHVRAKELSNEGESHKTQMVRLNKEAEDWIFYQNNTDSAPDEIDLHGLYVHEAVERTEQAIQRARTEGKDHLNIIVGKGLHSEGHVAKVKPAIEELMRKHHLSAHLDPHNSGVLIVSLDGSQRRDRSISVGDITDRLEREDLDCVIM